MLAIPLTFGFHTVAMYGAVALKLNAWSRVSLGRCYPVRVMQRGAPAFVLASSSAGRLRLLRDAGIDPEVMVSGVDETADGHLGTAAVVAVLAERKASAVAARRPDALVLGCDSLLDLDEMTFGKPASAEDAAGLWRRLSGRGATLFTGHCLIEAGGGAGSVPWPAPRCASARPAKPR